jgi:formylmethanofuran dehydrogenase subunit E
MPNDTMIVEPRGMIQMAKLLEQCAVRHSRLCPRQVLGVRMGLLAGKVFGLDVPNSGDDLLALVETDGCFADGVSVATGNTVGNRLLRVLDFGKVAATFIDMKNDKAFRIAPRSGIRAAAQKLEPDAESRWHAQLKAYQIMPDADLLVVQLVQLNIPLEKLLSKPAYRVNCEACGEEIINEREVTLEGKILCRTCAGQSYYRLVAQDMNQLLWQVGGEVTSTIQPKTKFRHQRRTER